MGKQFSKIHWLGVVIMVGVLLGVSLAAETATQEECVAKCLEAAQYYQEAGLDALIEKVNDTAGPFVWKDTYVYCMDIESGVLLAHPFLENLRGKSAKGYKDKNGKLFIVEAFNLAQKDGKGWFEYVWSKPGQEGVFPKLTYVYLVPGDKIVMLAGIYK